jgi:hypothetical protein
VERRIVRLSSKIDIERTNRPDAWRIVRASTPSKSKWSSCEWVDDLGQSGGELELGCGLVEALEQLVEVVAGELPLERSGDLLVAASERQERLFEAVEVGEVVGLQAPVL